MVDVTIANGAQVSSSAKLSRTTLAGIYSPVGLTSATFTIEISVDGGATFVKVRNSDGVLTYTANTTSGATGGAYYVVSPTDSIGIKDCLIRLATSATEGADRILQLIDREVA